MVANMASQSMTLVEPDRNQKHPLPSEVYEYRMVIAWRTVAFFVFLHLTSLNAILKLSNGVVHPYTSLFMCISSLLGSVGITAGVHRLWAHKTYKARWPLRVVLAFFQTFSLQNSIYDWARDHRVHHKFTDTNADPHTSKRGFFFCHMGWLMVRKHRDVMIKGGTVDISDLEKDWVVVFQRKHYLPLIIVCCVVLPVSIPILFWGEAFWSAWHMTVLRYTLNLHFTWLVNSAAHCWGPKPYDRSISATQNALASFLALGEGWHNYHHIFPWDYKVAELGDYSLNWTTAFLDACGWLGLAYDFKTVPEEMVRKRAMRTGDGSVTDGQEPQSGVEVWGWGDPDMEEEDKKMIQELDAKKKIK